MTPFFWLTMNRPSQNSAVSGGAPAFGIDVSVTWPLRASTSEPFGMLLIRRSGTNVVWPGSLISTVPLLGATTTD